jgi:hypothetical protein
MGDYGYGNLIPIRNQTESCLIAGHGPGKLVGSGNHAFP